MSLIIIIYLVFTAIPALKFLTGLGFVIWIVGIPTGMVAGAAYRDFSSDRTLWDWVVGEWIQKKWKLAIVLLLVSRLIPSQEVTAYMMAGYGVQKLAENETVQSLSSDGVDVLKAMLAKVKKELQEPDTKPTK
jgi:hypothetical protein